MDDNPTLIRAHLLANGSRILAKLDRGDIAGVKLELRDREHLLERLEAADEVNEQDRSVRPTTPPERKGREDAGWLKRLLGSLAN